MSTRVLKETLLQRDLAGEFFDVGFVGGVSSASPESFKTKEEQTLGTPDRFGSVSRR
jgi:hypothetical protein